MKGAIEKGITYVSVDAQELPLEGVQFISQYKEELVDGKQDILAIRSEIEEEIQGYEALLVEVKDKGLLPNLSAGGFERIWQCDSYCL